MNAGLPTADLGPSLTDGPSCPIAAAVLQRRREEQRELFRLAGVSALARSRNGRDLSPDALADVRKWAAYPPLQGPISSGEPAA